MWIARDIEIFETQLCASDSITPYNTSMQLLRTNRKCRTLNGVRYDKAVENGKSVTATKSALPQAPDRDHRRAHY